MRSDQALPNLAWIDEQLRRERAAAADLRSHVDTQSVLIEAQANRVRDLQERVTSLQGELHRIPEVERGLQQSKDEIVALLHSFRLDRRKEEKEAVEARSLERESDMRALANLAKELERISPLEEQLRVQDAEDRRLRETGLKLRESLEEQLREIGHQAESLRVFESRLQRSSETTEQTQARLPELTKALDGQVARLTMVEQSAQRSSQLAAEVQGFRVEIQTSHDQLLESQRGVERQRQTQMADWGRRMENLSHQLRAWSTQMEYYVEQHERDRQVVREMQEVGQHLRQELELIKQSQRIAEEQQRRELREWQGENEKRWNRHLEQWQQRLDEQSKLDLHHADRLDQLQSVGPELRVVLKELSETVQANKETAHSEVAQLHGVVVEWVGRLASVMRAYEDKFAAAGGVAPAEAERGSVAGKD